MGTEAVLFCSGCHIEYHRLADLNNTNLFFHSSGGWKSKIKGLVGLVPGETAPLGLQIVALRLCSHVVFPPCAYSRNLFLFFWGHQLYWKKEPSLWPVLTLITSLKASLYIVTLRVMTSTYERGWGGLGWDTILSITAEWIIWLPGVVGNQRGKKEGPK